MSGDFSPERKRYLEGFVSGLNAARATRGASGKLEPVGPDAIHLKAQDRVTRADLWRTYLPRKFKTVVAVPPSNDVAVFAHDLGFIAILDDAGNVTGWNFVAKTGNGRDFHANTGARR